MIDQEAFDHVVEAVRKEYEDVEAKYGTFASAHEAHSVIEEEFDELWDDIKGNRGDSKNAMNEAIQIAAMAIRYAVEITSEHVKNEIAEKTFDVKTIHGYKVRYDSTSGLYVADGVDGFHAADLAVLSNRLLARNAINHPFSTKESMEKLTPIVEPIVEEEVGVETDSQMTLMRDFFENFMAIANELQEQKNSQPKKSTGKK